jgi:hypothetical protein
VTDQSSQDPPRPTDGPDLRPTRLAVYAIAIALSIGGPVLAVVGLMFSQPWSPNDRVGPILLWVGSCIAAGVLFALVSSGVQGFLVALVGPIVLVGMTVYLTVSAAASSVAITSSYIGQGASLLASTAGLIEAGYLGGRFVAWLTRGRSPVPR